MDSLNAMSFRTYINQTRHRAISKCSYLQKKIASRFYLLQDRILSKFHHQEEHVKFIFYSNTNEVEQHENQSEANGEEKLRVEEENEKKGLIIEHDGKNDLNTQISNGSQVVKIIVIGGKIVEKEYLSLEGERTSLKF